MFCQIVNGSIDFFLVAWYNRARKGEHMIPILEMTWNDFWASCLILFAIYSHVSTMK